MNLTKLTNAQIRDGNNGADLPIDPDEHAERHAELAEAKAILEQCGIGPKLVEGLGEPAEAIVDTARENGADLVIVGTRGENAAKGPSWAR